MHLWILTIGLVTVSASSIASDARPPWSADFLANPLAAKWTVEPPSALGTAATWTNGEIRTRGPRWQSPKFAVEPSRYYRLVVRSKGQTPSMWAAVFFDAAGQQLASDHYSGLDASVPWTDRSSSSAPATMPRPASSGFTPSKHPTASCPCPAWKCGRRRDRKRRGGPIASWQGCRRCDLPCRQAAASAFRGPWRPCDRAGRSAWSCSATRSSTTRATPPGTPSWNACTPGPGSRLSRPCAAVRDASTIGRRTASNSTSSATSPTCW